jgi:Tol biopolymer transport system component
MIQEIPADGGEARTLVDDGLNPASPTFSPDGKKIAFSVGVEFGVAPARTPCVRILDLQSGQTEQLPGSDGLWMSRWSPDGRRLAAVTSNRRQLMVYDFTTHVWSVLSKLTINDFIWNRTGDTLYFDTRSGVDPVLFKIAVASGKMDQVAVLNSVQRSGFRGTHLSMSPLGEIVLLRDTGITDVYRLDVSLP